MTGVAERPRGRRRADNTDHRRMLLMEATIRSLAERGVGGTTVRAICAEAGVSRGLMTHYYPSKEALLADALRHLFDTLAAQGRKRLGRKPAGATARLENLVEALFSPRLCSPTVRNAFLALWREVRFNPAVRRANRQLYVDYWHHVEVMFASAAEEHGVTIDARRVASGLIALIDGLWLELAIDVGGLTRKDAIAHSRDYIAQHLRTP